MLVTLLALLFPQFAHSTIKIGAIFDDPNPINVKSFTYTVKTLGFEPLVQFVPPNHPFRTLRATQKAIKTGAFAILAPQSEENRQIVQALCDDFEVPVLDVESGTLPNVINFYPAQAQIQKLYIEVLKKFHFQDFVLLYDTPEALQRVLKISESFSNGVTIMALDPEDTGNYRPTLKKLWRFGTTHFALDCSINILEEVLRQTQQIGLLNHLNNFFIPNLDFQTIDFTPFQHSETNITTLRFLDPMSHVVQNISAKIFDLEPLISSWRIRLDTGLIIDAINIFGTLLKRLPYRKGTTMINLIKSGRFGGITGPVEFDNWGYRSKFAIKVLQLQEGGLTEVGVWNSSDSALILTKKPNHIGSKPGGSLENRTFIVIATLTEPYGMRKESSVPLHGNDRYEGFGIDLIQELSLKLGFNYTIIIREDNKNGEYNQNTGEWDGIIGDVLSQKADLAIADLTITSDRAHAVDFTTSFMTLGISILYQKAKKAPPSFFSFADPFSAGVWKLLAFAFFGVSITFFLLGRLAPSEWQNPYPCIDEPEFLVNQLSLRNCFWFMAGSLMQQGSEIAPIAVSTRMLSGVWWFFTLIMVSSYTANLAAFLTTEIPNNAFNDVFELVKNAERKGIRFGAKANGSTAKFFHDSKHVEAYQEVSRFMSQNPDVMVNDNKVGVQRAEHENYAFFMETTSIQYETQRRCSLAQIGTSLDEKEYGIAMRKNSSYRFALSTTILKLQEEGVLAKLKRKWWQERRGGGQCPDETEPAAATALNLKNVGGVFWVTIIGSLSALILVVIEVILHAVKKAILTKTSVKVLLNEELRLTFEKSGGTK